VVWEGKVYDRLEHVVDQLFTLDTVGTTSKAQAFENAFQLRRTCFVVQQVLKLLVKFFLSAQEVIHARHARESREFLSLSQVLVDGSKSDVLRLNHFVFQLQGFDVCLFSFARVARRLSILFKSSLS